MPKHTSATGQIAEHDLDALEYLTKAQRDKIDDSDFAWPEQRKFPIDSQAHLDAAAKLIGRAPVSQQAKIKARAIKIAKRKGFTLPDTWKDEGNDKKEEVQPKEALATPLARGTRLATMTTCFLEDGAISLNGRQYPREAVDRLIQSAQVALSDPNGLPLTCYLSHEDADHDKTRDLVGRITKVWREGTRAMAEIDIPTTEAGKDVVSLVSGGYIKSQSLRASGATMQIDSEHTFPQVGGESLKLEGIDFTTSPGLPAVARITDLSLAESHHPSLLTEVFTAHEGDMLLEQKEGTSMPDLEEASVPVTTGSSPSMDGSTADSDGYAARTMPVPPLEPTSAVSGAPLPAGHPVMEAMRQTHDHLARVLDAHLGSMHGGASEASPGKRLAPHQAARLADAHDTTARHLGMSCEGAYESALQKMARPNDTAGNDGMQDGDDDDANEARKLTPKSDPATVKANPVQEKRMPTPAEMARLLSEAGYAVKPPKTREELLREQLEARLAEERRALQEQISAQTAQLEEMKHLLSQAREEKPQRRSLAEGIKPEVLPQAQERRLSYIKEQIKNADPFELIDRTRPLPEWIARDPERALKEYQNAYLGMLFEQYGWPA